MNPPSNKAELAVTVLMRIMGVGGLLAVPVSWTVSEGPSIIAVGLVVLWLQREIAVKYHAHLEP